MEKEIQQSIRDGREAKRTVARAKEAARAEWYDKMETKEREQEMYSIAKMRTKKKDICHVAAVNDKNGRILVGGSLTSWRVF